MTLVEFRKWIAGASPTLLSDVRRLAEREHAKRVEKNASERLLLETGSPSRPRKKRSDAGKPRTQVAETGDLFLTTVTATQQPGEPE